jgi:hypothetical protein
MSQARVGILYTSSGDWAAVVWQGHIYDPTGEWMGYLSGRTVFSADNEYMGYITDDQRILRKRILENEFVRPTGAMPPKPVGRPPMPQTVPLPPPMRELTFDLVDMLEEFPERFKQVSMTRKDMD